MFFSKIVENVIDTGILKKKEFFITVQTFFERDT